MQVFDDIDVFVLQHKPQKVGREQAAVKSLRLQRLRQVRTKPFVEEEEQGSGNDKSPTGKTDWGF